MEKGRVRLNISKWSITLTLKFRLPVTLTVMEEDQVPVMAMAMEEVVIMEGIIEVAVIAVIVDNGQAIRALGVIKALRHSVKRLITLRATRLDPVIPTKLVCHTAKPLIIDRTDCLPRRSNCL